MGLQIRELRVAAVALHVTSRSRFSPEQTNVWEMRGQKGGKIEDRWKSFFQVNKCIFMRSLWLNQVDLAAA